MTSTGYEPASRAGHRFDARRSEMDGPTSGQQFIRLVNGAIYEVLVKLGWEDGEFWCECPDVECDERVTVTLREYAMLQKRSGLLLSRVHAAEYARATNG
jgi:hypothetical protein